MPSFLLLLLLVANHALTVTAFGPCPPPRFDEFSERLISSWTTAENEQRSVEEVMRSCGGAVQGIQEPLGDDSFYLNRANDGFVFYDHGCYTCGPVNRKDCNFYLSNLMIGNSRIVMSSNSDQDVSLPELTVTFQRRTFGETQNGSPPIQLESDPHSLNVDFTSKIMCSMPSAGQPWMLQRAKWEREKSKAVEGATIEAQSLDPKIKCWSLSQPASEFFDWIGMSDKQGEGVVVQMGLACEATSVVSVVARHYTSNDDLHRVLFLDANLV